MYYVVTERKKQLLVDVLRIDVNNVAQMVRWMFVSNVIDLRRHLKFDERKSISKMISKTPFNILKQ